MGILDISCSSWRQNQEPPGPEFFAIIFQNISLATSLALELVLVESSSDISDISLIIKVRSNLTSFVDQPKPLED